MKIAFLINNYTAIGGIERVVPLISNELIKNNEISIISLYSIGDTNNYKYDEKIGIYTINKKNKKNYILDFRKSISQIKEIVTTKKIDCLIYCGELLAPYALLSCKKTKTKCIFWTHTSALNYDEFFGQRFLKYIAFTKSFYIITLTNKSKQLIMDKYHVNNVASIPNPVDPALLNRKVNYNKDSKKIITVGRICKQKNYEVLMEVAKIVLNELSDWTWDIVGEGDKKLEKKLLKILSEYKLNDQIFFRGNIENIYDIYSNYSMIVMTSKSEGFPMVLLEGAANGLPLISFDVLTGPREIINNNNGVLINPFDVQAMGKEIIRLANDQKTRTSMSKYNIDNIYKYDISVISNLWRKLFSTIFNV